MMISKAYQIASIIASALTAVLAAIALWQVKLIREQFGTSFEDGLTQQYRHIMEDIPIEIWLGSDLKTLGEEVRGRCRDAIYRYIDLCQDQAVLHGKKRVTLRTWKEWSDGICSNLKLPAFKEVWVEVQERRPDTFKELRKLLASGRSL